MMPYGEPITVTTKVQSGLDEYGTPVYTTSSITRPGAFAPVAGAESTLRQDQVTAQPQVFFTGQAAIDVAAVVDSTSELTIRGKPGYLVDGEPQDWRSPHTGRHAGLVIPVKRITG